MKVAVGIELMTFRFVVNALAHCVSLLGNIIRKESICKIILDFTVYFDMKYVNQTSIRDYLYQTNLCMRRHRGLWVVWKFVTI